MAGTSVSLIRSDLKDIVSEIIRCPCGRDLNREKRKGFGRRVKCQCGRVLRIPNEGDRRLVCLGRS